MSSSVLYEPFSFPTILVSMLIRVIHEITFLFTNMTFASLQRVDQGNSNVFRVSAIYVVWGLATPYNDLFYTVQKRFAGLNKRVCVKHLLLCCYQSGPFFVWFILNLYIYFEPLQYESSVSQKFHYQIIPSGQLFPCDTKFFLCVSTVDRRDFWK